MMLRETNVVIVGYRPSPTQTPTMAQQTTVRQDLLIICHFTITLRDIALGTTPLDARRRDFYNTQHSQEADIHASGGIQTRNPSKRSQNHALDPAATGIGTILGIAGKSKYSTKERPFIYNMF
jgi:hypothetical protein